MNARHPHVLKVLFNLKGELPGDKREGRAF